MRRSCSEPLGAPGGGWRALAWCTVWFVLLWSGPARAGERDIVILPTKVASAKEGEPPSEVVEQARLLDQLLVEAAPDLGLTPRMADLSASEDDLPNFAHDSWVIAATLSGNPRAMRLRLVAVAPGSKVLRVRVQRVDAARLDLKAVVMLQEVIQTGGSPTEDRSPVEKRPRLEYQDPDLPPASTGRAVLALNTAVYGGYVGFTVHRASGSSDSRLLYPLTALGAGLGLGAAVLVSDEWNITQGTAWYLSASLIWPALAGVSLGEAYDDREDYRHLYGLAGATLGVTLGSTMVSLTPVTPGNAALAHSGGAFGTLLGGLTEALVRGELTDAPLEGMGYGSALGVLVAGALAPATRLTSSRVLFIDLSASLGSLGGAALATPFLLVSDDVNNERSRVWFASVLGGTVLGGALGVFLTSDDASEARVAWPEVYPYAGFVGESEAEGGRRRPLFGGGLTGAW